MDNLRVQLLADIKFNRSATKFNNSSNFKFSQLIHSKLFKFATFIPAVAKCVLFQTRYTLYSLIIVPLRYYVSPLSWERQPNLRWR